MAWTRLGRLGPTVVCVDMRFSGLNREAETFVLRLLLGISEFQEDQVRRFLQALEGLGAYQCYTMQQVPGNHTRVFVFSKVPWDAWKAQSATSARAW